jgi:diguanylate cyclase (GGDEF)-like protein/PAS domain S-box-containing protein
MAAEDPVTGVPAWWDGAPGPMLLLRGDEVIAVNATAEAELGLAADELVGSAFIDRMLDEDADELRLVIAGLETGTVEPNRGDDHFLTVRLEGEPLITFVELHLRTAEDGLVAAIAIEASQEHRLDAVLAHLASSTFVIDQNGTMVWRPFGNAKRLGVADERALGAATLEWVHPEELPELLRIFNELLETPGLIRSQRFRTRQPYIEGGWTISRLTAVNALDDPAIRGIVVRSEEQSEVEQVDSVGRTGGTFQSLAEAAPVGIVVTDREGRVLYRNPPARAILGEGASSDWATRARPAHRDELDRIIAGALQKHERGSALIAFDHRGGTTWVKVDAEPQTDEAGRPYGAIATLQDVTAETVARDELRAAQDQLWHLANHDRLTDLPNRSMFVDRLEVALARRSRDGQGVAVLYGDLDGFKEVNDRLGHHVGDAVLVEVARRIGDTVRDTDVACRFGGDEFLVLIEGISEQAAVEEIASRLIEAVGRPMGNLDVEGHAPPEGSLTVGLTVGVAVADASATAGALLARADNAMYRAKAAGKGQFSVYDAVGS